MHPFSVSKLALYLFLLHFLLLNTSQKCQATTLPATQTIATENQSNEAHFYGLKLKKTGHFQKWLLRKALKNRVLKSVQEGEEASKFAKLAMTLFAVSLVLSVLSVFVPLFSVLGGIGFVASLVMAIYILIKEKNPKSRKLARTILIVSATLILLSLILALLLIGLFITLLV